MNLLFFLNIGLFIVCIFSFVDDKPKAKKYLYTSHTRICNAENGWSIKKELEKVNYSSFDLTLLGGDMLCQSSLENRGMKYLDSIFNINSEKTLWSIGNHDDDNLAVFKKYTKRNNYYSCFFDGITFIILDSEVDDCKIINDQLAFIQNTLDTIKDSKNIIIMTHKLIWLYGNEEIKLYGEEKSNVKIGDNKWNIKVNNFYNDIYPLLIKKELDGINVICIAGDLGTNSNVFEFKSREGIDFLANGIGDDLSNDKMLVLSNVNSIISWEFIKIDNLKYLF